MDKNPPEREQPEELSQIRAKFVMAEEQTEEQKES